MNKAAVKIKKLLIIYPNWIPSNAVGVQRVRLIVNFLKEFNWEPTILSVNSAFYEEEKSDDLLQLVNKDIRIKFVNARKAKKIRIYGDIALRAFGNLKRKAIEIIKNEKIDCVWVPIPPFYTALIARKVYDATSIPYVVDYIDPWVHDFPGSHKFFSRAKFASVVANFLEPIAVKKAAGFTGVSEAYFLPVLQRNPHLKVPYCRMPYGFDEKDYNAKPSNNKLLWENESHIKPYIYAGAFLPNAHYFINILFKIISKMRTEETLDKNARFYFTGTGKTNLESIADYARMYHLEDIIIEKQERIPYLEVLHNLSNAAGVLAIGSTELHYTASKIFQSILSTKPIFGMFHYLSSVIHILRETNAHTYLIEYNEKEPGQDFEMRVRNIFEAFMNQKNGWNPAYDKLGKYRARSSAAALVGLLNAIVK